MFRWKYNILFTICRRQASRIVLLLYVLLANSSKSWLRCWSCLQLFSWWTGKKMEKFHMSASASILPPSFTICLFQMGQQFYFIFPWKLFCILKCVITEFKIVMIKSRVTGIVLPLSHKNCMRISTWNSLSTNLERGLALSKILLVHRHIIIISLTSDTVPTRRLFYYGKYWKNPE